MEEKEIDELLISLDANVPDEWEGGLICSPQNRDVVIAWLAKHRLTQRAVDLKPAAAVKVKRIEASNH